MISSPFLARKGVRGMVERGFQHPARGEYHERPFRPILYRRIVSMTTGTPRVSVVMSVYNDERYLGEAVESVLTQTFDDFEFIIVNDGSTDSSRDISLSYDDSRIRLIDNQKNLGLPSSLNNAIRVAAGAYVARQDADDVSLPDRLAKQVQRLEEDASLAMVGCWWMHCDEDGDVFTTREIPDNDAVIKSKLINCNIKFAHGSLMFTKDALIRIGGYDERFTFTQDLDLMLRMAKLGYAFASVDEYLYKFRNSRNQNAFKRRCQSRYRALAYDRYFSDQEVQIPDVLSEERVNSGDSATSDRVERARYWYSIGMRALSQNRYRFLLKSMGRVLRTGDVTTFAKFAAKSAMKMGNPFLKRKAL